MNTIEVKLVNVSGLSRKTASIFAREAKKFSSKITVIFDGKSANGKSVSSLSALEAIQGSTVEIQAEGDDAEQAVHTLGKLTARGLGDE